MKDEEEEGEKKEGGKEGEEGEREKEGEKRERKRKKGTAKDTEREQPAVEKRGR
jgi:hypothetical protein